MNLTPMQLYCQEQILLRLYPGKTLEEAKTLELQFGCEVWIGGLKRRKITSERPTKERAKVTRYGEMEFSSDEYTIIGLPPTLPRVLQALGDIYFFYNGRIRESLGGAIGEYCSLFYERKKKIERNLLNSDNTDATLLDQSEETQDAIALLLGWKDEV